jgi:2-polyprenyl-3-methyl-5-hydroxy-6-metoxy-1,4-benzoquinol methylase
MEQRATHWNEIYETKEARQLSWTEPDPSVSLELIAQVCRRPGARVIDVGGGTSLLADRLLAAGYAVAVLDISREALERSRQRLGGRAREVQWILADVAAVEDVGRHDVWHDRAVFHFLTDASDRRRYADLMARSVVPGGHAVIATFALDGPEKCSGLDVCRYDGDALAREIGPRFERLRTLGVNHVTPWGKPQSFQYSVFKRV